MTPPRRFQPANPRSRDKTLRFTSLWHHVYEVEHLREAYHSLKHQAAPGVDGQTWQEYGEELEINLQELSARLRCGRYRAKPVKRVYIPKPDGRQRPIGITALEDKIVQRATTTVLNTIYEADFKGFSYGFRPNRGAHNALDALTVGILKRKVGWVLDADICGFFDAIDRKWMVANSSSTGSETSVSYATSRSGSTLEYSKTIDP